MLHSEDYCLLKKERKQNWKRRKLDFQSSKDLNDQEGRCISGFSIIIFKESSLRKERFILATIQKGNLEKVQRKKPVVVGHIESTILDQSVMSCDSPLTCPFSVQDPNPLYVTTHTQDGPFSLDECFCKHSLCCARAVLINRQVANKKISHHQFNM